MRTFRYRDEDSSPTGVAAGLLAGALAGFAVGVAVAQRLGGLEGLVTRFRRGAAHLGESVHRRFEEEEEQYGPEDEMDSELEQRVLEAFRNDPILSERAVDIGSIGEGVIELSGWVNTNDEAEHAVTVARGVPGVATVVNRLAIGEQEDLYEENARRVDEGDPALTEARWEGQRVGTGRRRQGTSDEVDRHADPRPKLESRWLNEEEAVRNAAGDTSGDAERRRGGKKSQRGDRTGGSPISPTGVPKGDHVANPDDAESLVEKRDELPGDPRAD